MVDEYMIEIIIMIVIALVYGIVILRQTYVPTDRPDIPPPGLI